MGNHQIDWNRALLEQWERHWVQHVRPRLATLTDDEYFWEPVADSWNVRRAPGGDVTIDFAFPEPVPAPVTTIAWRLGHVIVGVLAMRNAAHFGAPPAAYETWGYAGTARTALDQLDDQLGVWTAGVRGLSEQDLSEPVGDKEPLHPEAPTAELVLHIHRELIHHLSEVLLLRDLHLRLGASS